MTEPVRVRTILGGSGWRFVETWMERLIENGTTTPEAFAEHFEEEELGESWNHYLAFREREPDAEVPADVNRILSRSEFVARMQGVGKE